jgi:hypothetical protein
MDASAKFGLNAWIHMRSKRKIIDIFILALVIYFVAAFRCVYAEAITSHWFT